MRRQIVHLALLALLLALLLVAGAPLAAQTSQSPAANPLLKLDPGLKLLLFERSSSPRALGADTARIALFVDGREKLPEIIGQLGGSVHTSLGRLVTAEIPIDRVLDLAARDEVEHIEMARPVQLHNDSALVAIGADRVHDGRKPLLQALTGRGVLLGFIDTGIDFLHEEFRSRSDSSASRIVAIWSQVDPFGPAPEGFDYGSVWTREQIAEAVRRGSRAVVRDSDQFGHGTHVAASAAGLGGVAPDADIAMVHFHNAFASLTTDVLDGAAFLYSLADRLGEPCVINASLGTADQPEDGSDALARGLDELIDAHPGRFFCASAGNGGRSRTHWGGFAAEHDSLWTVGAAGTYSFRIPEKSAGEFEIDVIADVGNDVTGRTPVRFARGWKSVEQIGAGGLALVDTAFSDAGHERVALMEASASPIGNGFWSVQVRVSDLSANLYRVMVRGAGLFHAWSSAFIDTIRHSTGERWRPIDNGYAVASPSVAHNVISVGAMVNRSCYTGADGRSHPTVPDTVGELSSFSSRGPSSDGRMKPDIVAPGQNVISARSSVMWDPSLSQLYGNGHYLASSGTSMSCPFVVGSIALYLERHPAATVDEVRQALHRSALTDVWTGSDGTLPNGAWGYGKLNVFGMLASAAAVHDAAGRGEDARALMLHPNPTAREITIETPEPAAELAVYDPLGRLVYRSHVQGTVRIEVASWPSGLYRCVVTSGHGTIGSRFIVAR